MSPNRLTALISELFSKARRVILAKLLTRHYSLVDLDTYASNRGLSSLTIDSGGTNKGEEPVFIGNQGLCNTDIYGCTAPSPSVSLYQLENVSVVGRTEFILSGAEAVYPTVIDPQHDVFMMEREGRGKLDLERRRISIFLKKDSIKVEKAISLLGQCNGNYAHWVTEVLTRLVLIDEYPEFHDWPILVDDPVHEKLLDALDFLNTTRHPLIHVKSYQRADVGLLAYVTPASMTPPETREFFSTGKLALPRREQFHFSAMALAKLRMKAISSALDCLLAPKSEPPWSEPPIKPRRRFFFHRSAHSTGNGRLLINSGEISAIACEFGFEAIDIADYSFQGQVLTAHEAEVAASPIGASLVNLVFRAPGCTVIIFTPQYTGATFFYFANLMIALGHKAIFVMGAQTRHGGRTIYNRDFWVSAKLTRQGFVSALEITQKRRLSKRSSLEHPLFALPDKKTSKQQKADFDHLVSETWSLISIEQFILSHASRVTLVSHRTTTDSGEDSRLGFDASQFSKLTRESGICVLSGATALGSCDFVICNGLALFPKQYCVEDFVWCSDPVRPLVLDTHSNTCTLFPDMEVLEVESAISLLGRSTGDYALFVTDILCRLELIKDLHHFKKYPILVDFPNEDKFVNAFDFANTLRQPLIFVRPFQKVEVSNLVLLPSCCIPDYGCPEDGGGAPFSLRSAKSFSFAKRALMRLRDSIVPKIFEFRPTPRLEPPWNDSLPIPHKRFFLNGTEAVPSTCPVLVNAMDVYQVLKEFGFAEISFSALNFEERVLKAQESAMIVSVLCPDLINLVFARPRCSVVVLVHDESTPELRFFSSLMDSLGHDLIAVVGTDLGIRSDSSSPHRFRVTCRAVREGVLRLRRFTWET